MNDNNNRPEQDRNITSGLSSNKKKDENSVPSKINQKNNQPNKNSNNKANKVPLTSRSLITNQLKRKMGETSNNRSFLPSLLPKNNFLSNIKNNFGLGSKKTKNEGENSEEDTSNSSSSTGGSRKEEISSNGPIEGWAKFPPQIKLVILTLGGGLVLIIILLIIIISIASMRNDRKTQQAYISGNLSKEKLCELLVKNGFAQSIDRCENSRAYMFYDKIKNTVNEYRIEKNVSIIPGLIYETISYNRTDAETYKKYKNSEIEALADAMVEEVKETCYTYKSERLNNGNSVCKRTKIEWTYNQVSFDKYISYLKFGKSSKHPNYSGKPRTITNTTCQGPVDDTLCGKQQGSDTGSKKTGSTTSLSGGCPSANQKDYPTSACTGETETTGGTNNENSNNSSFIELDGKNLTVYNQDKYKDKMCRSGCETIISTSGCSAAAYSAAVYLLTNNMVSLPKVANDFCSTQAYLCGAGGVGGTIVSNKKLQSTYKVGGKSIARNYDSFVNELKKNRVILISVKNGSQNDRNGKTGFNASSSGHYILLAKYNAENDQIFVYNPNGNRNSGWRTKEDINKYVANVKGSGAWYLEKK